MNTNNLIAIYIQFQTSLNSPAGAVKRQVLSKGRCCQKAGAACASLSPGHQKCVLELHQKKQQQGKLMLAGLSLDHPLPCMSCIGSTTNPDQLAHNALQHVNAAACRAQW